jgi:hypothetical protein
MLLIDEGVFRECSSAQRSDCRASIMFFWLSAACQMAALLNGMAWLRWD